MSHASMRMQAQADVVARFVLDIEAKDGIVQGPKNWKSLRDIAIGFVVASHVTTATALTWFLYLVSSHPDVEEKILKELKEFESTFAPSSSGDPGPVDQATRICQYAHALTYEALSKMQYLHAAVSETVRLYPSVPLVSCLSIHLQVFVSQTSFASFPHSIRYQHLLASLGDKVSSLEFLPHSSFDAK